MGICNSKRAIRLEDDGSEDELFEKVLDNHRRSGMTMVDDSDSSNERVEYLPPEQKELQQIIRPPKTIVADENLRRPSTEQEWAETVASIRDDPFLMSEEEAGTWESSDDDDLSIDSSDDNDDVEEPVSVRIPSLQPETEWKQKDFSSGTIQKMVFPSRSSSTGSSSYEEVTVNSNEDPVAEDDFEKNFRSFGDMAHSHDGSGSDTGNEGKEEVAADHYSAYITEQRRRASDYSYDDFLAGGDNEESSYEEITVDEEGSFMDVTVSSMSADGGGRLDATNLHVPDYCGRGGFNPYDRKKNDYDVTHDKSLSNSMIFDVMEPSEPMAPSSISRPLALSKNHRDEESELNVEHHEFTMLEESGSARFFQSFAWDSVPIAEETPSQVDSSEASTSVKRSCTKPPLSPLAQQLPSSRASKSGPAKSNRPSLNNSISSLSERDLVQFLGLTPPTSSKKLKLMESVEETEAQDDKKESHVHRTSSPTEAKKKKSKPKKKSLGEVLDGSNQFYPKMEDDRTFTGLEIDASEYSNADLSPISLKGFQGISKKKTMQELQDLLTKNPPHDENGHPKLGLPELQIRTIDDAIVNSKSRNDDGRTKLRKSKISRRIFVDEDEVAYNPKNEKLNSTPPTASQKSNGKIKFNAKTKASKRRSSVKKTGASKKIVKGENDVISDTKNGTQKSSSKKKDKTSKKKTNLKKKLSDNHAGDDSNISSNNEATPNKKTRSSGQPRKKKKKKGSSKEKLSSSKYKGEKKSKKSKLKDTTSPESTPIKKKTNKIKNDVKLKASKQPRSSKILDSPVSGKKSASKKKKVSSKKSRKKITGELKSSKSVNDRDEKVRMEKRAVKHNA